MISKKKCYYYWIGAKENVRHLLVVKIKKKLGEKLKCLRGTIWAYMKMYLFSYMKKACSNLVVVKMQIQFT